MNGKPVLEIPAKTVINFKSGFEHKLLCDGPTFTTGDACTYSCSFCYVPSVMNKRLHMLKEAGAIPKDTKHENVVMRRKGAEEIARQQLLSKFGIGKTPLPRDFEKRWEKEKGRVIYGSPLVDVGGNIELADETIEVCKLILDLTPWDIRLLSKSTFLPRIAQALGDKGRERVIYGVSTGTFDDKLAAAFEEGCPKVSKRIESLKRLRDLGCRTFGMICPSLPHRDYTDFACYAYSTLNPLVTEHVWAEVINVRGESMERTFRALSGAGYLWEAEELTRFSRSKTAWENYSRATFEAHSLVWPAAQLRFLQYVNNDTLPWWNERVSRGAVLL